MGTDSTPRQSPSLNHTISILCATDAKYVPYCGVMLTSVFESNRQNHVEVFILTNTPLSNKNCRQFERLARKYDQTINYIIVDDSFLERFPIKGMDYWSIATYYRLYAAELLPSSVHRVLYLDCDIIVQGDLQPLWELDMTGKAVAGVSDIFEERGIFQKRLSYPKEAGYFNAGVLLINIDYWRENSVGKRCLEYLSSHYDVIEANDQDVLNAVLWDNIIKLPLKYNFQIQFFNLFFYTHYDVSFQKTIHEEASSRVITHYAAPQKPWQILYYKMPYKRLWQKYKWKSEWWYLLPQWPKKKTVNYLIKRYLLWPMGIMYTKGYMSSSSTD